MDGPSHLWVLLHRPYGRLTKRRRSTTGRRRTSHICFANCKPPPPIHIILICVIIVSGECLWVSFAWDPTEWSAFLRQQSPIRWVILMLQRCRSQSGRPCSASWPLWVQWTLMEVPFNNTSWRCGNIMAKKNHGDIFTNFRERSD